MRVDGPGVSPIKAEQPLAGTTLRERETAGEAAPLVDQILDGLAEGFFALDSGWRFTAFNRAAEEMFDMRRDDVLGKTIWEVSPTTVGTEFERRYRKVMIDREKQIFENSPNAPAEQFSRSAGFPSRRRDRGRVQG